MNWSEIIGHGRPKKILQSALERSHIAHAYLFHGETAIGKRFFSRVFAQAVLCDGQAACGECRPCLAIRSGSHPDLQVIDPEGSQIKIEQIRNLQDTLVYKPFLGVFKILILNDAELMNPEAANCFLKTLEEPPDHSLIILITAFPNRLLSTILSRCQKIRFESPKRGEIAEYLMQKRNLSREDAEQMAALSMGKIGMALGADLASLKAQRDEALSVLLPKNLMDFDLLQQVSHKYAEDEETLRTTLNHILIWVRDLLIYQHHSNPSLLINIDRLEDIKRHGKQMSPAFIFRVMTLLASFHRATHRHLNRTLILETVLLEFRNYFKKGIS